MVVEMEPINGSFLGLPLDKLYRLERKERHKDWPIIKAILDKYYKENSPELERVIESLLKLMELEISPKVIKDEEVNTYFETFKHVDNKFSRINKLIETLPKEEKKELYLSYSDDLITKLKKEVIPAINNHLLKKEEWDYNDPLIVPYLNQLLSLIIELRDAIRKAKGNHVDDMTLTFSVLVGFYSVVLYGYVRGKLIPDITSKRYAELVARVGPVVPKISEKTRNLQAEMSSVPIV